MSQSLPARSPTAGLSSAQAQAQLAQCSPNELPQTPQRGVGRIVLGVLSEPMFLLLVVAAGIYLAILSAGRSVAQLTQRATWHPVGNARAPGWFCR